MHYSNERLYGCRISDSWEFKGLKTIILENEILKVTVLADNGADIYEIIHKKLDIDFMWRTPWGVRNPSTYIPSSGWGEGIWHDSYVGGWQTIAPTGGIPQKYHGADIGFHTEASLMPWDYKILEDTKDKVSAKFYVRTIRTPFWIEKTITLKSNSPIITIEESLTNEAEEDMDYQWGQHVALGEPFLTENCILDLPSCDFFVPGQPGDNSATLRFRSNQKGKWPLAIAPDGSKEDLRKFPPKRNRKMDYLVFKNMSEGWYAVSNPELKIGFGLVYPENLFRYTWFWQEFGGGYGYPWYGRTYNVGLEPFTSLGAGDPEPDSNLKTDRKIGPGETVSASIKAVIFDSDNGVKSIDQNGKILKK